jgi:hypothetical protein
MLLEDTILKLFALVDSVVELYLGIFIKPFLSIHEKFYTALNTTLRKLLEDHRGNIPDWCTANFITYARTVLVVPTLLFLAWDYQFVPSILVLVVDFGDFLDGVVARFWMDIRKEIDDALSSKEKATASPPTSDDDESYRKYVLPSREEKENKCHLSSSTTTLENKIILLLHVVFHYIN